MFLHFTEAQMFILNHDVLGLCTNDFSSYVDMEFVYLYITISFSVLREGSKEEQVCWLVLSGTNMFEIKINKYQWNYEASY